jgi:hypothetical protein
MLHTFAGKILKSSYFWLPENPGCYIARLAMAHQRRHALPHASSLLCAPSSLHLPVLLRPSASLSHLDSTARLPRRSPLCLPTAPLPQHLVCMSSCTPSRTVLATPSRVRLPRRGGASALQRPECARSSKVKRAKLDLASLTVRGGTGS